MIPSAQVLEKKTAPKPSPVFRKKPTNHAQRLHPTLFALPVQIPQLFQETKQRRRIEPPPFSRPPQNHGLPKPSKTQRPIRFPPPAIAETIAMRTKSCNENMPDHPRHATDDPP